MDLVRDGGELRAFLTARAAHRAADACGRVKAETHGDCPGGLRCASWQLRVTSRDEDRQTPNAELGRVEVDHPRNLQLDALDTRRRRIDLAVDCQQPVDLDRAGGRRP